MDSVDSRLGVGDRPLSRRVSTTMSELRRQIEENGYVVVREVVPKENVEAVVADLWKHTGADPNDPETWYNPEVIKPTGMVEMYHYQSMWDNRQAQSLYDVFAEIHGTTRLWVSLDRANLKPPSVPEHPEYYHKGFMHWDADLTKYPNLPFRVQGVLALADTDENMGGFQCVPEIYRDLDAYLEKHGKEERRTDLTGYEITKVPLNAGDIVIWTNLLAHGNGDNQTTRPRMAQYISMNPVPENPDPALRERRINSWRTNSAPTPGERPFPGDPRRIEEQRTEPAKLTALGRKLLGVDDW